MEESRSTRLLGHAGAAVWLTFLLFMHGAAARGMSLEDVARRARTLAATAYQPPRALPRSVRELGYDQHRGIRHRPECNLWGNTSSRFELAPLAPGNVYKRVVRLNEVIGSQVRPIRFDKKCFNFDDRQLEQRIPAQLGFAGFELRHDFSAAPGRQNFFVFAGASYFRGCGAGGQFGLSVRGVAVDTGLPSGEEFPEFVEFWLVRPAARAASITLYALLDGPSLAGAYEFVITPGAATQVDVRARLYTRKRIAMLGMAALTSMYFYGENTPRPLGAWRPEVHDSDGLAIESFDGQRSWQPLRNPAHITLQSFPAGNTRRFGLLQRDTRFASYQDPGTNYHRRPSASVELLDGMRGGRIVLVQLPTANEFLDNIVAFWAPAAAVPARSQLALRYRLDLGDGVGELHSLARAVDTFVGRDVIAANLGADKYRFIIDFARPQLHASAARTLRASITPAAGTAVLEHQLEHLASTGTWRLAILARAPAGEPVALSAALHLDGRAVTETWRYELEPGNVLRGSAH